MDSARPGNPVKYLNLQEAANSLAVSVDVLLAWNDHDILKPTISPTGDIAYTQDQIDKFLAIQKTQSYTARENSRENYAVMPQNSSSWNEDQSALSINNSSTQPANNFSQINNYNFYNAQVPPTPAKEEKSTFSFLGIVATFSFLGILTFVVLFSQQNKLNPLKNNFAYDSNNSTVNQTTDLNNSDVKNNNLNDAGGNVENDKSSNFDKAFNQKSRDNSSSTNYHDQVAALQSILGKNDTKTSQEDVMPDDTVATYGQTANFASSRCPTCSKNSDTENKVFDTHGNIKVSKADPSENDLLASALGASGFTQSQSLVKQSSDSSSVVGFIILGLICLYFLYSTRKQLIPSSANMMSDFSIQPISFTQLPEKEKIMEVGQKTDGTVVVYLQGKEYKISKPELDSESDKFIERMMELVSTGVKEIEYDILSDDKLAIAAPLSKVVTRLGFVGIKRDLFFPRTSKTRVLFRRYITLEDLFAMNLTVDEISSGFEQVN
jgi:hypothetical protein